MLKHTHNGRQITTFLSSPRAPYSLPKSLDFPKSEWKILKQPRFPTLNHPLNTWDVTVTESAPVTMKSQAVSQGNRITW